MTDFTEAATQIIAHTPLDTQRMIANWMNATPQELQNATATTEKSEAIAPQIVQGARERAQVRNKTTILPETSRPPVGPYTQDTGASPRGISFDEIGRFNALLRNTRMIRVYVLIAGHTIRIRSIIPLEDGWLQCILHEDTLQEASVTVHHASPFYIFF